MISVIGLSSLSDIKPAGIPPASYSPDMLIVNEGDTDITIILMPRIFIITTTTTTTTTTATVMYYAAR